MGANNAEKRDGEARPNEVEWARHEGDSKFHVIVDGNRGGSTLTRCEGRWPADHCVEWATEPATADRCGWCEVKR